MQARAEYKKHTKFSTSGWEEIRHTSLYLGFRGKTSVRGLLRHAEKAPCPRLYSTLWNAGAVSA